MSQAKDQDEATLNEDQARDNSNSSKIGYVLLGDSCEISHQGESHQQFDVYDEKEAELFHQGNLEDFEQKQGVRCCRSDCQAYDGKFSVYH